MNVLKKTTAGTLGAYPYEENGNQGIGIGLYDSTSQAIKGIVFLEVEDGKVSLVINDKLFQEKVGRIKHV